MKLNELATEVRNLELKTKGKTVKATLWLSPELKELAF